MWHCPCPPHHITNDTMPSCCVTSSCGAWWCDNFFFGVIEVFFNLSWVLVGSWLFGLQNLPCLVSFRCMCWRSCGGLNKEHSTSVHWGSNSFMRVVWPHSAMRLMPPKDLERIVHANTIRWKNLLDNTMYWNYRYLFILTPIHFRIRNLFLSLYKHLTSRINLLKLYVFTNLVRLNWKIQPWLILRLDKIVHVFINNTTRTKLE